MTILIEMAIYKQTLVNNIDGFVKSIKNCYSCPIFIGIKSSRSPEAFEFPGFHFHACALKRYGAQARE